VRDIDITGLFMFKIYITSLVLALSPVSAFAAITLFPVVQVPEPSVMALFGIGLVGVIVMARRRRS
jgi:hypothetical protein